MHRHSFHAELDGGLVTGVTANDHRFGIHPERLPEAELADRLGNRVNGSLVQARVVLVWSDGVDLAFFDKHGPLLRNWGRIVSLSVTTRFAAELSDFFPEIPR